MSGVLKRLRGALIVSVQASTGSALDDPAVLAALARAAQDGGAAAVRIEGVANVRAVRERVGIPIFGIIKRPHPGYEPYITSTLDEVRELLQSGVDVIAFDATDRARPRGIQVQDLVEAIHAGGKAAMADCAMPNDGAGALRAGADALATTLCGYTKESDGHVLPALGLVAEFSRLGAGFVVCEGGVHSPAQAAEAMRAGADAVVVGTAITNTQWLVERYASALRET